ncbi:MAG: hypothetical protein CL596_10580 [Alteromonas sp.]|nr:hypothetical protein [Alteromonas sp.]MAY23586.1 hypothetical protein [Flavobacteriaceae bacterium]|tara:strand:+ start:60322 stop:60810 length:489 start_codon:yes stop_codon:yes gene_type:complete
MKKIPKYPHGFKTPKGYFEGLEEQLFAKVQEEKLPKDLGFKIPETYFETFEARLLTQIPSEGKSVKVIPFYRTKWLKLGIAIAASLVLGWFILAPKSSTTLEVAEVENYIESHGLDMASFEIAQLLSEEEIDELIMESEFLSSESMEDYLLENLDDTTLLIE